MNYKLIKATNQHEEAIKNLMQFYMYDFSEFVNLDVEANGLFTPDKNLDDYWKDDNRFPYIIQQDEKYLGFVLVRLIAETQRSYFSIAEFFVMKKYRREGIGKAAAHQIFNLYKGTWEVFQKETNKPAQLFWKRVIDEYTQGKFSERFEDGKIIQDFVS